MTQSEKFGKTLQSEFYKRAAVAPFGEVSLFRALIAAFGDLSPKFPAEEYHGAKHQVYYNNTKLKNLRPRARCELCDLLLISYSIGAVPQIRLSLLQAKLSRDLHPGLCKFSPPHSHCLTDFYANYEQWNLLSTRPMIDSTSVFAPPANLLRAAIVPSIGSFGVFHANAVGLIDMFYVSADTLRPIKTPTNKYGRLKTTTVPLLRDFSGFKDKPVCCCLATFGQSLFELQLGTPVLTSSTSGSIARSDPLASFLKSVLTSYLSKPDNRSTLAREVVTLLDEVPGYEILSDSLPSLVVVKGSIANNS